MIKSALKWITKKFTTKDIWSRVHRKESGKQWVSIFFRFDSILISDFMLMLIACCAVLFQRKPIIELPFSYLFIKFCVETAPDFESDRLLRNWIILHNFHGRSFGWFRMNSCSTFHSLSPFTVVSWIILEIGIVNCFRWKHYNFETSNCYSTKTMKKYTLETWSGWNCVVLSVDVCFGQHITTTL